MVLCTGNHALEGGFRVQARPRILQAYFAAGYTLQDFLEAIVQQAHTVDPAADSEDTIRQPKRTVCVGRALHGDAYN